MEAIERIKSAFAEEANVFGLASATSLSLILLNPIPLVIGIAAEAAYLCCVPRSRWYSDRLTQRAEAEVVNRRLDLKDKTIPFMSDAIREENIDLGSLREQLSDMTLPEHHAARWAEFLERADHLLDSILTISAKQSSIPSSIEKEIGWEKDFLVQESTAIRERRQLLDNYELEAQSLRRFAEEQTDTSRQEVLMRNVWNLESEIEGLQQELFQLITGQVLAINVWQIAQQARNLLFRIEDPLRRNGGDPEPLITSVAELQERVDHLADQQADWLNQAIPTLLKKSR